MSPNPWNPQNDRPCRHLRSKEMFYDTGTRADEDSGSGLFWCTHTDHPLGPDGKPVADEDCGPQRDCYEQ